MSFDNTIDFKDHIVQYPNRFKQTTVAPGVVELVPTWITNSEEIIEPGTPVDSELFKKLKQNVTIYQQTFTTTENQTVINLNRDFLVGQNRVSLSIGGVRQYTGQDYTETDSHTLTMTIPQKGGLKAEIIMFTASQAIAEDFFEKTVAAIEATQSANDAATQALAAKETAYTVQLTPVANFAAIATMYPMSVEGSEVQTLDDGKIYRKENESWIYRKSLTPGPVADLLAKFEAQKYFVNVKEFDVKGDGSTNDTQNIQRAINHIKQLGGGTLFFPAGTYVVQPSVIGEYGCLYVDFGNITFLGVKGCSKILFKALNGANPVTTVYTLSEAQKPLPTDHYYNINNNQWRGSMFYMKGPQNTIIKNVTFENFELDGNIPDAYNGVRDLTHKAINHGDSGAQVFDMKIVNCHIHNFLGELLYSGSDNSEHVTCIDTTFEQSAGSIATWAGSPRYYRCRFLYGHDAGVEQSVPPNGSLIIKDCYFKECSAQGQSQVTVIPQYVNDNKNTRVEIINNYFDEITNSLYHSSVTIVSFGQIKVVGNTFRDAGKGLGYGHACVRVANILSNYPNLNTENVSVKNNNFIADNDDVELFLFSDSKPSAKTNAIEQIVIKNNESFVTSRGISNGKTTKTFSDSTATKVGYLKAVGNTFLDNYKRSIPIPSSMQTVHTVNTFEGLKNILVKVKLPTTGNVKVELFHVENGTNVFTTVLDLISVQGTKTGNIFYHYPNNVGGVLFVRASSNVAGSTLDFSIADIQ